MTRLIIPLAGVGLLVASGVLYAIQTGHTRDPEVMAAAARRVEAAQKITVEGWTAEAVSIADEQLTAAEAAGGGSVRYSPANGLAADGVNVMLLCGPHGPISVHPPTACFQGVGYRQVTEQRRERIRGADGTVLGTFWVTEFEHEENGVLTRIRTWWAWTPGGPWQAPESPRMMFAGEPALYKLYMTEHIPPTSAPDAQTSEAQQAAGGEIVRFAKRYLPKLNQTLGKPITSQTEAL